MVNFLRRILPGSVPPAAGVGALVFAATYVYLSLGRGLEATFLIQLSLIGLAVGSIYAMAGLGLVLTYKATGVFNFAHGAIGVLVAYVNFQLNTEWGVPVGVSSILSIGVVAPGIGILLERFVFRPLQRGGASTTEKLVATLGVFVLIIGIVVTVWTGNSRVGPSIYPATPLDLPGGIIIGVDQLLTMLTLLVVALALYVLFQRTSLGTKIRAVVDKPELAELASINANRISAIAWAMGGALAGLSGVLFAAGQLDPFRLTLFMLETLSVAVLARLTSLPLAIGSGVLILGLGRTLFAEFNLADLPSSLGPISIGFMTDIFDDPGEVLTQSFENLKPNFSTLVLFAALLMYRRLDTVGEAAEQNKIVTRVSAARSRGLAVGGGVVMVALPFFLDATGFDSAHRFLAFIVIFVSIVAISGFAGQITLGQAGFAGLGAFAAARLANGVGLPLLHWTVELPVILAMIAGGLVAMFGGFVAGFPALRRRGLFLALTTVAFGLFLYAFVLANSTFAGDSTGLDVQRPHLLWWDLSGTHAFYYYELVIVGAMLALARNLRSGRLGRALAAMRDSESGATSVGIDLRTYKMFIFAVSSFMAGIGGAMLTQQAEVFNAIQFFPLESLFWFAVVVVAGLGSIAGAVLGAAIWIMLDVVVDVPGLSQLTIGAGALLLGRLPGGNLVGMVRVGYERAVDAGRRSLKAAVEESRPSPPAPRHVPSRRARELLDRGVDEAPANESGRSPTAGARR